jgi:catechol 2,3-dioxygenase-like lactoylglutathione lyase family enzyme
MLHHLSFAVADLPRAAKFYDATLHSLGYVRVWADETAVGYGAPGGGDKFAIKLRPRGVVVPGDGFHVAFAAPSRESVAAFYEAALSHGGSDNGGSGLHPEYGPNIAPRLSSTRTDIASKPSSMIRVRFQLPPRYH